MRVEEKFSKYFRDSISVGDDMWLVFERDQYHKGTKSDAVEVKLHDNHTHSTTRLATFHNGRWTSPNSRNAELYWSYVKAYQYQSAVRRILERLTCSVRDLAPVAIEWNCLTRRFRLQSIKVSRKIKKAIN